jgi:hypothetical protein
LLGSIQSILNYKTLDFFLQQVLALVLFKIYINITSFVDAWFINKSSQKIAQIFQVRQGVKLGVKKKSFPSSNLGSAC